MHTTEAQFDRRALFGAGAAGAALAGAALAVGSSKPARAAEIEVDSTDRDILNFALNLEYLEAEFYLRGVTGQGLDQAMGAGSLGGDVTGGRAVNFSDPTHRAFLQNVAQNELEHVRFLRTTLDGKAIPRPRIDFTAGFQALARAANLGANFDPFADEQSFFLAAYVFEDVGVTAYKGAAPLIQNKTILQAAATIYATEAYHAGMIRTVIYKMGDMARQTSESISAVRDRLSGSEDHDHGVAYQGRANIIPANENGIAYSRTPQHVLNIVYANPAAGVMQGGFFPEGANGKLRMT